MRSFLIRDILSSSAAATAAADEDEVIDVDEVDESDELAPIEGQPTTSCAGDNSNNPAQTHHQRQHQQNQHQQHLNQQQQQQHFLAQNSPLAALFQMTSSTFDGLKRKGKFQAARVRVSVCSSLVGSC